MYSLQIDIPESRYDVSDYYLPSAIDDWLNTYGLRATYAGSHRSGTGYTDGISNVEHVFMIRHAKEADGLAFSIMFPGCKIHSSKQENA